MDTLFWGPGLWVALHSMTFDYPENPSLEDKQRYRAFFHTLKYVLPCGTCRAHYTEGIEKKMPIEPALKNRDTLSRWLVDFHNSVNQRLGKPIVSYESVKEKYNMMRGQCQITTDENRNYTRRKTDHLLYLVIVLLIVIIGLAIYYFPKLKQKLQE